jgi:hypothetical protein
MAATPPRDAARKWGCYQYRCAPTFDKRVKTELIVSQVLLIGAVSMAPGALGRPDFPEECQAGFFWLIKARGRDDTDRV